MRRSGERDAGAVALRCPACGAENAQRAATCTRCAAALPSENRFVSEAGEIRYRIILGDTCPVCRAAARISFTAERPPRIPVAGCRDPSGCRCSLPIFASELDAALAAPEPSLATLAPARGALIDSTDTEAVRAAAGAVGEPGAQETPPPSGVADQPPPTAVRAPEWTLPAPLTLRRQRDLAELTDLYYKRRIQGIRIQTAPGCCRVCAEVASSIYEPSVAPILPVVGCWHGWQCRCMYAEEPLPLDERGRLALQFLAAQEWERGLRRRGVARVAPRRLHEVVLAASALAVLGALGQELGRVQPALWQMLVPCGLALVCAALAVGAMRRWRPLPPPVYVDLIFGLTVLALGLRSAGGDQLGWPARLRLWTNLSWPALQSMPRAEQLLTIAGLGLVGAGLVALAIGPGYRRLHATD